MRATVPPPGASHRLAVLHELIKTCLEHLYRNHRGQLLEEFIRCYPELGKPGDLPVPLVYEEFRIRAKFSTRPALKEYRSRFPKQFDELRMLASREFPEQPTRAGPRAAGETLSAITLPPDAPPQILWVAISSTARHAGDTLTVTVLTSSNVASVELRVGGYGNGMTKVDVGHFQLASLVPKLPIFMGHNLTLQIIARNTAGVAAQQNVPLHVR